jgi:serine/threonine-protein kinase HipA
MELNRCPSTLQPGHDTYSQPARRLLFNNKKVSHILPFNAPENDETVQEKFRENRKYISISGVQNKLSLLLEGSELRLTKEGEHGQYILKPIPDSVILRKNEFLPANEHLTMQIARQVFGLRVAENALIFFEDGSPAYITKRFDFKPDGTKYRMEDFASISGRTKAGELKRVMEKTINMKGVTKKYFAFSKKNQVRIKSSVGIYFA